MYMYILTGQLSTKHLQSSSISLILTYGKKGKGLGQGILNTSLQLL